MSGDDIVERLRHVAWLAEEGSEVVDLATTAADEIVRLRAAGDALAELLHGYECLCWTSKCRCGHDAVLAAWREARRG